MGAEFWIIGSVLIVICGFLFANYRAIWRETEAERILLRDRLTRLGLDSRKLSDACLDDLIDFGTTSVDHLNLAKSSYLPVAMDRIGKHVGQICNGDPNFKPNEIGGQLAGRYVNPYWKILEKHHPELFALDELHITQSFGKVRLSGQSAASEGSTVRPTSRSLPLFGRERASDPGLRRKSRGQRPRRKVLLG